MFRVFCLGHNNFSEMLNCDKTEVIIVQVRVNDDCIGCGMCINVCPEVFDFNKDGLSTVIGDANAYPSKVEESAEVCPTNAIEIED